MTDDPAQARYLRHQARKKAELIDIMQARHSERRFADEAPEYFEVETLVLATANCPSSCDRHGVKVRIEHERDRKDLLSGLLVGGTGWIHRAPWVLMLWADASAYKAGNEVTFNSYLDAGVMLYALTLGATELGLASAICNPAVRPRNVEFFTKTFKPRQFEDSQGVFCGAVAVGRPMEGVERSGRSRRGVEVLVK